MSGGTVPEIKLDVSLRDLESLCGDIRRLHKENAFSTLRLSIPKTDRIKIPGACCSCDSI